MVIKSILTGIAVAMISTCCIAQDLKSSQIKIDTAAGHGYEIMYVAEPIQKQVFERVNNSVKPVKEKYFREYSVTWIEATKIADTLKKKGWFIPSMYQLKQVFTITQSDMDKKDIRVGSLNWQGVTGFFWALNDPEHDINNASSVVMGGTINNREFVSGDVVGKGLIDSDDKGGNGKKRLKLILLRPF